MPPPVRSPAWQKTSPSGMTGVGFSLWVSDMQMMLMDGELMRTWSISLRDPDPPVALYAIVI